MKISILSHLVFTSLAIIGFTSNLLGQDATIIQGKNAKAVILSHIPAGIPRGISSDQQYLYGSIGTSNGFFYNFNTGITQRTDKSTIQTFVSPTHYSGMQELASTMGDNSGVIFYNGEYIPLALTYDTAIKSFLGVSIWSSSTDGKNIAAMGWKRIINPLNNRLSTVNLPFIYDGTTGKIIDSIKPHWPMVSQSSDKDANTGYGARIDALSANGKIAVGYSTWPATFSNMSPVFWDRSADTSFFVGTEKENAGNLWGCNSSGSILVGALEQRGLIVYYDTAKKSFTTKMLDPSPGYGTIDLILAMDNGNIIGQEQISGPDVYSRVPFVYTKNGDFVFLSEYLKELYGLDMGNVPLFTIMSTSSDGRTITGYTYEAQQWIPYAIKLDEKQMYALPRFAQARSYANALKVQVSWTAPLKGQYTLSGYNIYRDSVKLNTTPLAANAIKFEDVSVTAGTHKYQVQAIYTDGVSDYTAPISVIVIPVGGCYPIQTIDNTVIYNRTANIYWGRPSSKIETTPSALTPRPATTQEPIERGPQSNGLLSTKMENMLHSKGYSNHSFNFVKMNDFGSFTAISSLLMGDTVYSGDWQATGLKIFDANTFRLLNEIEPLNLPAVSNMVQLNGSIYCACNNKNIYVFDPETQSVSMVLPLDINARHIAYIPELDNGKGGFEIGDWQSSAFYSLEGVKLTNEPTFDFSQLSVNGTAYYKGNFYAFSQSGKGLTELYYYNFANRKLEGVFDVSSIDEVQALLNGGGCAAGGLSLAVLEDSTMVLGATVQYDYTFNHLVYLEIASAPNLAGFNLLRNGTKINTELLKSRNYTDIITTAGTYSYTVEAVQENGCKATSVVSTKLEIYPIEPCLAPKQTKVFESNNCAVLNWDYTPDPNAKLVGFNIYQNE
ncbi:MAG: hypothetical protein RR333_07360, partial [Bacteroidales bacterium]